MIKALFFDIDGTLVSFNTHEIPASTVAALEQAKKNGLKICIATGRPIQIVTNIGAIEHLVDGMVTTNGACCYSDKTECTAMTEHDVMSIVDNARHMNVMLLVVGVNGLMLCNPDKKLAEMLASMFNVTSIDTSDDISHLLRDGIVQITAFVTEDREAELLGDTTDCHGLRWYPAFVDINSAYADKAKGIEKMAGILGIDISETMAFGDGGNDISMIRHAAIGVAMGNALPNVQKEADYVTDTVDNDGVAKALKHFKLIE